MRLFVQRSDHGLRVSRVDSSLLFMVVRPNTGEGENIDREIEDTTNRVNKKNMWDVSVSTTNKAFYMKDDNSILIKKDPKETTAQALQILSRHQELTRAFQTNS